MNRRNLIQTLGLSATALMLPVGLQGKQNPAQKTKFKYCLNTSTISGKKPGIEEYVKIAGKAGYDGLEIWIRDLQAYVAQGKSLKDLKKMIEDQGLKVENAIGFAPWMVDDDQQRKAGFQQMKEEMELLARVGCFRVAAAPAGYSSTDIDYFKLGARYRELLDLGRSTGVMPQLEFWGASPSIFHFAQILMIAAAASDPDVRLLPDIYHLFRGNSGFESLKMVDGRLIEVFHFNDYTDKIPREQQKDKDRVYPGDGIAPVQQVIKELDRMGGEKVLSLELFNETYWQQDPQLVANTGLAKMKEQVSRAKAG